MLTNKYLQWEFSMMRGVKNGMNFLYIKHPAQYNEDRFSR